MTLLIDVTLPSYNASRVGTSSLLVAGFRICFPVRFSISGPMRETWPAFSRSVLSRDEQSSVAVATLTSHENCESESNRVY